MRETLTTLEVLGCGSDFYYDVPCRFLCLHVSLICRASIFMGGTKGPPDKVSLRIMAFGAADFLVSVEC